MFGRRKITKDDLARAYYSGARAMFDSTRHILSDELSLIVSPGTGAETVQRVSEQYADLAVSKIPVSLPARSQFTELLRSLIKNSRKNAREQEQESSPAERLAALEKEEVPVSEITPLWVTSYIPEKDRLTVHDTTIVRFMDFIVINTPNDAIIFPRLAVKGAQLLAAQDKSKSYLEIKCAISKPGILVPVGRAFAILNAVRAFLAAPADVVKFEIETIDEAVDSVAMFDDVAVSRDNDGALDVNYGHGFGKILGGALTAITITPRPHFFTSETADITITTRKSDGKNPTTTLYEINIITAYKIRQFLETYFQPMNAQSTLSESVTMDSDAARYYSNEVLMTSTVRVVDAN